MLSSNADSIFWMSRYLERSGNIARYLDVNWHMTLEASDEYDTQWEPLITTTGDIDDFASRYDEASRESAIYFLTSDEDNPNSIISCTKMLRLNAMRVRHIIPTEMWENINIFYHYIKNNVKRPKRIMNNPYDFCLEVKRYNTLIGGIAFDIMDHDEKWNFFNMGRFIERSESTTRILDVKYHVLLPSPGHVGTVLDHVQWNALLKAVDGLESFRQRYGNTSPGKVASFLLLDRLFPSSVLFCLNQAHEHLHAISNTQTWEFSNIAEKQLGQLCNSLSYCTVDDVVEQGLHEFIDDIQIRIGKLQHAITDTFFTGKPRIEKQQFWR